MPRRGQLLEGVDRLLLGPAAGRRDRREVERATDDRRRREHLRRGLADRPEPFAQQLVDAARHRRPRRLLARQRRDDMERQPLRIGGQSASMRARPAASPGAAPARISSATSARDQPAEDDGVAPGTRARSSAVARRRRSGPRAARRATSSEAAVRPAGGRGRRRFARRVVGQVQVVDPDETGHRTGGKGRQGGGDRLEQADPGARPSVDDGPRSRHRRPAGRSTSRPMSKRAVSSSDASRPGAVRRRRDRRAGARRRGRRRWRSRRSSRARRARARRPPGPRRPAASPSRVLPIPASPSMRRQSAVSSRCPPRPTHRLELGRATDERAPRRAARRVAIDCGRGFGRQCRRRTGPRGSRRRARSSRARAPRRARDRRRRPARGIAGSRRCDLRTRRATR